MAINLKYLVRVRRTLIAADTVGLTYTELKQKLRTPQHPSAELKHILQMWRKRHWVDEYYLASNGGLPKHVYRATQLLIDQWQETQDGIMAIMLAPGLPLGQGAPPAQEDKADADSSI